MKHLYHLIERKSKTISSLSYLQNKEYFRHSHRFFNTNSNNNSNSTQSVDKNSSTSRKKELNTQLLDDIFSQIKQYLQTLRKKEGKVIKFRPDDELKNVFDFRIDDKVPATDYEILEYCKKMLEFSVRTGHPNYHNTLFGGFSEYALIGDYIQSTLNGSVFTYEQAPIFTLMEDEIGKKYAEFLGWPDYDFIFCPGGSFANLYGLITARFFKYPEVKNEGTQNLPQLKVFTSELAHYSIEKASIVMGIGRNNIIKVKTDSKGRMIPSDLDKKIEKSISESQQPIVVNCTLGTTVFGANDPVNEIAEICQKYGIWLHIDSCYGGSQLFLDEFRKEREFGLQHADSLAADQHKVLNIPQQSTIFLTKHKNIMESCNSTNAAYLFMKDKVLYDPLLDTGDRSIQCSRHLDIAKLWLYWRAHSTSGIQELVKHALENTKYLADLVKNHPNFLLIVEPEYLTVCFFYFPDCLLNKEKDDEFWKKVDKIAPIIKAELVKRGNVMIAYQKQESSYRKLVNFFRPSITLGKDKEDMDYLVNEIHSIGKNLQIE